MEWLQKFMHDGEIFAPKFWIFFYHLNKSLASKFYLSMFVWLPLPRFCSGRTFWMQYVLCHNKIYIHIQRLTADLLAHVYWPACIFGSISIKDHSSLTTRLWGSKLPAFIQCTLDEYLSLIQVKACKTLRQL